MITHELNTPLSVMRMMTDSMRRNYTRFSRTQIAEYVELLANSTDELSAIVDSMLLALQIDSGRAQELYERWSGPQMLRTALEAVIMQCEPQATEREVRICIQGFEQPLWIKAHEQQLCQIFSRVLDNAIRFSPKGEFVLVSLACEGEQGRVTFADHGPGMSADEISSAFDRLHQINRDQQEQQGVGMSLSLARSLVHIHGGEITVDSEPGKGTSFHIWLPLIAAPV
jgi:signal transduction histidine kinase